MQRFSDKKVIVEKLINPNFEKLANILGDFLFLAERTEGKGREEEYIRKLSGLMDYYAARCDNVINSHKIAMVKELSDIFLELFSAIDNNQVSQQFNISQFLNKKKHIILAGSKANKNDLNLIEDIKIPDLKVSKAISSTIELIREEKDDLIQSLFESFDFSVVLKDLNNNILNLNNSAAASLGDTISGLKKRNLHDILPKFSKFAHEKDLQVIKNNKPIKNIIQEFTFSNGKVATIMIDKIPIITTKQEPLILNMLREMPSVANNR